MGHDARRRQQQLLGTSVYDVLRRPLSEGDLIVLRTVGQPIFRIERIDRSLESAGTMFDVTLSCLLRFRAAAGMPNEEFLMVAEADRPAEDLGGPADAGADHGDH